MSGQGTIKGRQLLTTLRDKQAVAMEPTTPYFGEVVTVVGDLVTVKTAGASGTSRPITRAKGSSASIGDRGVIIPTSGGGRVFIPVGKEALEPYASNVYSSAVVDGLIASLVAADEHRRPAHSFLSGNAYNSFTHGLGAAGAVANATLTAGRKTYTPMYLPEAAVFSHIGVNVTTAVAASNIRLGVFTLDLATSTATRIFDAGTIATATTGVKELAVGLPLGPGWVWLGFVASHAITIPASTPALGWGWSAASNAAYAARISTSSTYSAFGATESTNSNVSNLYTTYLKAA